MGIKKALRRFFYSHRAHCRALVARALTKIVPCGMRLPTATKGWSMGAKNALFYDYRAHCRAIGHALRMKLAAARVALAKQLQCAQWESRIIEQPFEQQSRATLTVKAAIYGSL